MSVEHKRPLLAFIIVAVICGMVIGHALATQALPGVLSRPVAVVDGLVFAPAQADEPAVAATSTMRAVAAPGRAALRVVPATSARSAGTKTSSPSQAAHRQITASTVPAARHTSAGLHQKTGAGHHYGWARHTAGGHGHVAKAKHAHQHPDASRGRWEFLPPAFRWR